jgi:ketosteroid isomerase-like protein
MMAYQSLITEKRWDEWAELWAENGVCEFPYAPRGRKNAYVGRAEILAYMSGTTGKVTIDGTDDLRVHPALDPHVAIVEVTIRGHVPATGAAYGQTYVSIFEVKDSKLQHYREYWNPLVSIDAQGGDREAWTRGFGAPTGASASEAGE